MKKEQHIVYIGKYIQHSKYALLAGHFLKYMRACVCVGVRVCEREREREREREGLLALKINRYIKILIWASYCHSCSTLMLQILVILFEK